MNAAAPGAMTSVHLREHEARGLAAEFGLDVCALNAPDNTVLGGRVEAIGAVEQHCSKRRIGFVRLSTSSAFHSRQMAGAAKAFEEFLKPSRCGRRS